MNAPWHIQHVDLSEDVPALPHSSAAAGYYVVFWWRTIPLGQQYIPAARLPISAVRLTDLAVRAIVPAMGHYLLGRGFEPPMPLRGKRPPPTGPDFDALAALDEPFECLDALFGRAAGAGPRRSVSVVICTRDRPESLVHCLRALQQLARKPDEVVVIDNAPATDATRRLVETLPGMRYVLEPRPGLSRARNTGIRETTGAIVAFTDDDVVVHPHWVVRLERAFDDPAVMAVTGLVLPAELETEAQVAFERSHKGEGWGFRRKCFDSGFYARMKRWGVPVWQIGAGANMAFRRDLFERVGGFDERLGAGASGCSEDSELWYRVLAEGGQCLYDPTAVVFHHHRRTQAELQHMLYQYMRGHVVALFTQFERYHDAGNLYRAFAELPKYYLKLSVYRLLRRTEQETLREEVQGYLAGFAYYFRHRHTAAFSSFLPGRR